MWDGWILGDRLSKRPFAILLAAGMLLAGCAGKNTDSFWKDAAFWQDSDTNAAMTAYVKGDYMRAEQAMQDALRRNPKDPYAILVGGLVYEATGRGDVARMYYNSLISLQPEATASIGSDTGQPMPVVEIARRHLARLDGKASAAPAIRSEPFAIPTGMTPSTASVIASRDGAEQIITRFRALKSLADQGLITPEEYSQRRRTNLGALLPLTGGGLPGADLDRPAPGDKEVAQRLQAIGQSMEVKAISAGEYATEREMILEGVLPAKPSKREAAKPAPATVMAAADAVGRLERMREAGVISADEMAKEREAVMRAVQAQQAKQEAMLKGADPAPAKPASGGAGVYIASYKSEDLAKKAWTNLTKKHADLSKLKPVITKAEVKKATVYRLHAGGLPNLPAAEKLCGGLKKSKIDCKATMLK